MQKTKTPAEQRAELQRELEEKDKKIEALEHEQEQLDHQMTRAKNTLSYMNAKDRKPEPSGSKAARPGTSASPWTASLVFGRTIATSPPSGST